ncbi:8604_t:CDS:2 [Acaulospora morrowiae]|uniref:8604_t:CDS:1 n=1 Tax=Acaulospora morrowiae TaxID=94023 RepID=A0A9N8VTJ0_9GLOM|nr:8604_t:CDS:2 [Acaulospora morrowiae]
MAGENDEPSLEINQIQESFSPLQSDQRVSTPLEIYSDNPSVTSVTAPLLYTSFEGPECTNGYKCGGEDEDSSFFKNKLAEQGEKKLWIAICISLLFFCIELTGGLLAGSLALLSDSFHLLSDVVSFAISLLSIYLARRPATKSLSYGYHRAEILGALVSIIIIWLLTAYLCYEASDRINNPKLRVDGQTMCITASIGVAVNIVLIAVLGHHHGHGEHGEHDNNHKHGENVNVRAALLHVLGDLLSSVGVLISSIIIICDPNMAWVDPLCTFIFSALVMATTFGILRSGIRVLMEATPSHIDSHAVKYDLELIEGVESVHDLHIWDLTIGRTTLTAHLRLHEYNPDVQAEPYVPAKILHQARLMLRSKYKISSVTIQIESVEDVINMLKR